MTNGSQRVKLEKGDFRKIFTTVFLAVSIPIFSAMLFTWRDVAVLKADVTNLANAVQEIKEDLRELRKP